MREGLVEKLCSGKAFTILGLIKDGVCLAKNLIDSLPESDEKKVVALLKRAADHGPPNNKEKFKPVEGVDHLYEFKSFQIRIFCIYEKGRKIILLDGLTDKKQDKLKPAEIARAVHLLEYYKERK